LKKGGSSFLLPDVFEVRGSLLAMASEALDRVVTVRSRL